MVQQNTHLFTGTIRENIRYGNLEASDAQVYEAAKLANADYFIQHLENGYDTVITGDGAEPLRGGARSRAPRGNGVSLRWRGLWRGRVQCGVVGKELSRGVVIGARAFVVAPSHGRV